MIFVRWFFSLHLFETPGMNIRWPGLFSKHLLLSELSCHPHVKCFNSKYSSFFKWKSMGAGPWPGASCNNGTLYAGRCVDPVGIDVLHLALGYVLIDLV